MAENQRRRWRDRLLFRSKKPESSKTSPNRRGLYSQCLNYDQFRLLRAHYDETQQDCLYTLDVHSIDTAPTYLALSHTWYTRAALPRDDVPQPSYSQPKRNLLVNGAQVEVAQNVYDAVRRAKKLMLKNNVCLWVDAICIRQGAEAADEKSRQVALMTKIFERPFAVYAWLGSPEDLDKARAAVEVIKWIGKRGFESQEQDEALGLPVNATIIQWITENSHVNPSKSPQALKAWDGIVDILNLPYWSRAWILQEVTSTCGRVGMWYGPLSFDALELVQTFVVVKQMAQHSMFSSMIRFNYRQNHSESLYPLLLFRLEGQQLPLSQLLLMIRSCACSDQRDKVYAISGLMTPIQGRRVVPDYSLPVDGIFSSTAKLIAQEGSHGLFSLLIQVQTPADEEESDNSELTEVHSPGLPSWVPDWRQRWKLHKLQEGKYTAATSLRAQYHIFGDMLFIKGFVIDVIVDLSTIGDCEDGDEPFLAREVVQNWFPLVPQMSSGYFGTGESASVVFGKTIVADCISPQPRFGESRRCEAGDVIDVSIITNSDENDNMGLTPRVKALQALRERIHSSCRYRRLCTTSQNLIGLCPAGARLGDLVVAFHGSPLLYVIRVSDGNTDLPRELSFRDFLQGMEPDAEVDQSLENYVVEFADTSSTQTARFIGDSYIHGMMDGQALTTDLTGHQTPVMYRLV